MYYWSVQSIDHSGAASAFADEESFRMGEAAPRILSVTCAEGTVDLKLEITAAGSYSLMTSLDLITWTDLEPVNYGPGTTSIRLPAGSGQAQFFRLRKNP